MSAKKTAGAPGGEILVVDDTPDNITVLKGVLSEYKVKAATNGEKALKILSGTQVPDIVLLDVMMPGMDGYEVLRRMRMQRRLDDVPVIFVTAMSDDSDEAKGLQLGAVDYITKPIRPEIVLQRVTTHLELRRNRMQLRDLGEKYSAYISPQLAEGIRDGSIDATVGSARKRLTVFFSDIQGFTKQTDKLEPEDMTSLLNDYFETMAAIVEKHGGTLDKYIGDAVLVFFGDPNTKGEAEDAAACISMALEMQAALPDIAGRWKRKGIADPLRVRMGVTTGYCTVGNFGSKSQLTYTLLGTPVNLAARLQAHATAGSVLVSAETYHLVSERFSFSALEAIEVKGISYPIKVYEVKGAQSANALEYQGEGLELRLDPNHMDDNDRAFLRKLIDSHL